MKNKLVINYTTIFKLGYIPFAPGTFGSIFALLLYFFIPNDFLKSGVYIFSLFVLIIFSIFTCNISEKILGKDDSKIIIDELIGYFISVLLIEKTSLNLILALFFFRIFDIFKPFPIKVSQKLKGGLGIVLDDVIAGIYANFFLNITIVVIKNIKIILLYI